MPSYEIYLLYETVALYRHLAWLGEMATNPFCTSSNVNKTIFETINTEIVDLWII